MFKAVIAETTISVLMNRKDSNQLSATLKAEILQSSSPSCMLGTTHKAGESVAEGYELVVGLNDSELSK